MLHDTCSIECGQMYSNSCANRAREYAQIDHQDKGVAVESVQIGDARPLNKSFFFWLFFSGRSYAAAPRDQCVCDGGRV